ncbi:hypothetical protein N8836_00570 [Flavobacteriaceae bacterium]|jgi:hypothetical protein|nr:hypothetical protein [Flavobacteriaceae bacterium]MDA7724074.1 hypothetical protein [Flavobacteriaceae bacterium]MDA7849601.1 hypothetical protein [Flavobacteriaceae bacterium]
MKIDTIITNYSTKNLILSLCCILISFVGYGQVSSSIDSTAIKIGAELFYKIHVKTDSTSLVVFSEEQTFQPLEMINSYAIDTTKKEGYYQLTKTYGLTQFDSGVYTIPKQKITIGNNIFFTDSIQVQVNTVVVDTTKQKLFDIKPLIEVDKKRSDIWGTLGIVLLFLLLIGGALYWLIWRKKPLTEAEKIAALPPYERAKLALEKLDEDQYFENEEIKTYYSDLTLILRQYLDEKVYEQSLESTTDELLSRLKILKAANQIKLSKETIQNIETILKRADLVKFAKSKPDYQLAKLDKNTIELEIDHVKEGLPEPTEEELLQDLAYREALAKQQKRKRIKQIVAIVVGVFLISLIGLVIRSGFTEVKDTVLRNPSKLLLEKTPWVTSEYGAPGITISTPEVLERQMVELPEEMKGKVQTINFAYAGVDTPIDVVVNSSKYAAQADETGKQKEVAIDLLKVAEGVLDTFEKNGTKNITTRNEQFITPNGQEGIKTFGTAEFLVEDRLVKGQYIILGFSTPNLLQQVLLTWKEEDVYADQMVERILNSIELIKLTEDEK